LAARMDGLDDFVVVDALQVYGCDAEVAVAKLALDDHQRHALAREFDGMGVAKLVRSEAPPDARLHGGSAQTCSGGGR
jgi:hypothetical protein